MSRVVVLGGLNMDLILHMERLPRPGETVEAHSLETTPGGKGANQAVAAARAIGEADAVTMVGKVGDDAYGRQLCGFLAESGVDVSGVSAMPGMPSGLAVICIDAAGENTVTALYGANAAVGMAEADAVVAALEPGGILLVQQETPLEPTLAAMRAARDAGATVILDPAPARTLLAGFLGQASIITPNQTEAEALSGIAVTDGVTAGQAARIIVARHGVETVIVTLGEGGAFVLAGGKGVHMPAFDVDPVASVAGGDAFNGALAAALALGEDLEAAVRFASAGAALCVMRQGAGASMPYRAEILELLANGRLRR
jgi:ribokinase